MNKIKFNIINPINFLPLMVAVGPLNINLCVLIYQVYTVDVKAQSDGFSSVAMA